MADNSRSSQTLSSCLVFGIFGNSWAWRVEWLDASGRLRTRDFAQHDLRPGEAIADAKAFQSALSVTQAA